MTVGHAFNIGNLVFKILKRLNLFKISFFFSSSQYGLTVANKFVSVQIKLCALTVAYALPEKIVEQKVDFFQQLRSLHWDRVPIVSQSGQQFIQFF